MWKIGNIEIKGRVVLAPMAGITSVGYREFMIPFGISLAYTEMVSDMGLIYGNEETLSYLPHKKSSVPIGIQLFGHEPKDIANAAIICENKCKYFDFFDINMGCPVPKVTKVGSGSALMLDPMKCGDIVRAIKAVSNKPVTAKIRLGYENTNHNFLEVIHELEKAGVDAIAIHPRTRTEYYAGKAHYEEVVNLREKMNVPLIISGDIFTLEDAIKALDITKADAVMIARGGMGNPMLVKQINEYLEKNENVLQSTLKEKFDLAIELADHLIEEKGEMNAMRVYRGIVTTFFNGFPGCKPLKKRLSMELVDRKSLIDIFDEFKKEHNID